MESQTIKHFTMATTKTTDDVQIRYELTYIDFMGRRQAMSYIPTLEEAIDRKNKYYNSIECDAKINKVVEHWKNDNCVKIQRIPQ